MSRLNFALIKDDEQDLLDKIGASNSKERTLWNLSNVRVPLFTIFFACLIQLLFSQSRFNIYSYINIILNGSIPLIAINQISAIGLHVFQFEKGKEKKYGLDLTFLRTKLFYNFLAVASVGVVFYAFQAINTPWFSVWMILILIISSSLFLWWSTDVAKKIFFLQESLIDKTFEEKINKEADAKHGNDW